MEFRWLALLTLWTLLIGPIMNTPQNQASPTSSRSAAQSLTKK